jgi:hypothetical protein
MANAPGSERVVWQTLLPLRDDVGGGRPGQHGDVGDAEARRGVPARRRVVALRAALHGILAVTVAAEVRA